MNQRLHNLDFLRFLACVSVLITHARKSMIDLLPAGVSHTTIGVAFFFMLAGFFTYYQVQKRMSGDDFIVKKIIRLWPVIIFSYVLVALLHAIGLISQTIQTREVVWTLFFIRSTGLTSGIAFDQGNSHLWFVGPMVCACAFYFFYHKSRAIYMGKNSVSLLAIVVTFFSFVLYLHNPAIVKETGIAPLLRAFAGVGVGYYLAGCCEYVNNKITRSSNISKWMFTAVEIIIFYIFIDILFIHCTYGKYIENDAYYVMIFAFLVVLFFCQKGYLSQLFNMPWFGKLGIYSFSIYVLQYIPHILLYKGNLICETTWYASFKSEYPFTAFWVFAIIIPIFLGGGGYYLVEKPSTGFLTRIWKGKKSPH